MPDRRFQDRTRAGRQNYALAPAEGGYELAISSASADSAEAELGAQNQPIELQAVCGSLPSGLAWSTALGSCCAKIWVI